jgi:tetratricopeptide (TPR) repeat protein
MSQSLNEIVISQKLSLISDSINTYQKQGDNQKVISICENGLLFLSKNNLFYTPASCVLCLQAAESCMDLKDYYGAKSYFYKSFVLDELGEFGIGTYTAIVKKAEEDANITYFKELLELAKSDTIYLQKLAIEPVEFGSILNNVAWANYNKGEYSSALDYFEMEISLLDALGKTGNDDYLSIIPCEVMCIIDLRNYNLAKSYANYYLNLVKYYKGHNTIVYAEALQTKAKVEDNFGYSKEALELYNESLSLIESIKGKNNMDYICCLRNWGITCRNIDDNHIKYLEVELEIEKLLTMVADVTIDDKILNLHALSCLYSQVGESVKSLDYAKKTIDILETEGLINYANYYYDIGLLLFGVVTM